jgi:hypothetical protein
MVLCGLQAEVTRLQGVAALATSEKQAAESERSRLSSQLALAMDGLSRAEAALADTETRKAKLKVLGCGS